MPLMHSWAVHLFEGRTISNAPHAKAIVLWFLFCIWSRIQKGVFLDKERGFVTWILTENCWYRSWLLTAGKAEVVPSRSSSGCFSVATFFVFVLCVTHKTKSRSTVEQSHPNLRDCFLQEFRIVGCHSHWHLNSFLESFSWAMNAMQWCNIAMCAFHLL